jgi:hypothetical protein
MAPRQPQSGADSFTNTATSAIREAEAAGVKRRSSHGRWTTRSSWDHYGPLLGRFGGSMRLEPQRGDFVRVRSRRWLVEDKPAIEGLKALRLACVDDDAQGETAEVLWDAELDGEILGDEGWASVARLGTDDPSTFAAYLRTLRWNTATASDRDLFQAPFRAGIHLDAYQLLPLRKALRLPRVNLLIADDVGARKTVEAGLVLREMLLRRRVDFVLLYMFICSSQEPHAYSIRRRPQKLVLHRPLDEHVGLGILLECTPHWVSDHC